MTCYKECNNVNEEMLNVMIKSSSDCDFLLGFNAWNNVLKIHKPSKRAAFSLLLSAKRSKLQYPLLFSWNTITKLYGYKLPTKFYNLIMIAYLDLNLIDNIYQLFNTMQSANVQFNSKTYHLLSIALTKSPNNSIKTFLSAINYTVK